MYTKTATQFAAGMIVAAGIVAAVSVAAPPAASDKDEAKAAPFSKYVDKNGQISRPTDYREKFTFLGSYAVATNPKEPLDELHNVYTRPEDVDAYQRDGKFADGTVLIKEVTGVATEKLTTGQSHWATDTKLWFVMVKDSKGRFKDNDLWGDGWGWALFYADKPAENVASDYTTDCKTCHVPAKKDDWVYIRGYPLLKKRP